MAKIKLTKGELKKQRDSLKQFRHYLPTLQLKKQQLQMKILEARNLLEERQGVLLKETEGIDAWKGLLADSGIDFRPWIVPEQVSVEMINIAGANVPIFSKIYFPSSNYDLYTAPFWVDEGLEKLRLFVTLLAEIDIVKQRINVLEHELRVTAQRVNLFEKVKIPECLDNIRVIRIYLGDQQTNAVGVSKVAKKKIEAKVLEEVGA